jgi:hypothetical protein
MYPVLIVKYYIHFVVFILHIYFSIDNLLKKCFDNNVLNPNLTKK